VNESTTRSQKGESGELPDPMVDDDLSEELVGITLGAVAVRALAHIAKGGEKGMSVF
jgi:hypothetical protein